jgi:hypothetical protein
MSSKNSEIKVAIDSFDTAKARDLLREALSEANAETYYLASRVAIDETQKKEFLEKAIALDPFHEASVAALRGSSVSGRQVSYLSQSITQGSNSDSSISTRKLEDEIRMLEAQLEASKGTGLLAFGAFIVGLFLAPVGIGVLIIIGVFYFAWSSDRKQEPIKTDLLNKRRELFDLKSQGENEEGYKSVLRVKFVVRQFMTYFVFGTLEKGEFNVDDEVAILQQGSFILGGALLNTPVDLTPYVNNDGELNRITAIKATRASKDLPAKSGNETALMFQIRNAHIIRPGMLIVKL